MDVDPDGQPGGGGYQPPGGGGGGGGQQGGGFFPGISMQPGKPTFQGSG